MTVTSGRTVANRLLQQGAAARPPASRLPLASQRSSRTLSPPSATTEVDSGCGRVIRRRREASRRTDNAPFADRRPTEGRGLRAVDAAAAAAVVKRDDVNTARCARLMPRC